MRRSKRWEIAICGRGTVHIHYGTGSLHVLAEDFHLLARDMQEVAVQLEIFSLPQWDPDKIEPFNNNMESVFEAD